ncbi:MAG: GatB/YqeY domain-containing protein [Clostridia bacterium]|nr:GatB/YqeY domain-containing protein [Clostridia bacterium]
MLKEKLLEDLKISMRDKNVIRKNTVQMIRAAILKIEKDTGNELDDNKIIEVIAKEQKGKKDALVDFEKAQREDLIEQTKEEMKILEEYLPKQLSKEELKEKISKVIEDVGATSMKDMGIVMKEAKARIGAAADGRAINEVVKEILG